MPECGTFEATDTERAPAAYLVPAELEQGDRAAGGARRRRVTRLKADDDDRGRGIRDRDDEHRRARVSGPPRAHGDRRVSPSAAKSLPAGTVVVPMNQPLARRDLHAAGAALGRRRGELERARRRVRGVERGGALSDPPDARPRRAVNVSYAYGRRRGAGRCRPPARRRRTAAAAECGRAFRRWPGSGRCRRPSRAGSR